MGPRETIFCITFSPCAAGLETGFKLARFHSKRLIIPGSRVCEVRFSVATDITLRNLEKKPGMECRTLDCISPKISLDRECKIPPNSWSHSMVVAATRNKNHSTRLAKYSVAAVAVAATGLTTADLDAAIVSSGNLGNALLAVNSQELFVSLNGFTEGALAFGGFSTAVDPSSVGNPLAGNTDIMLRGAGFFTSGNANISARNGGWLAVTSGTRDELAINLPSAGVLPTGGAGTYFLTGGQRADLFENTQSPDHGNFNNPPSSGFGSDGFAHFHFTNKLTGLRHYGWLDITISDGGGAGTMQVRINEIFYQSNSIPEPASSMTLLCMGAAGLAAYRRRRKS